VAEEAADDEALIRQAIAGMAAKAGERDVNGILEHVSERYRGEGGDKRELKRYLLGYLLRSEVVTALPANVQLQGPSRAARPRFSFVVLLARKPAAEGRGPAHGGARRLASHRGGDGEGGRRLARGHREPARRRAAGLAALSAPPTPRRALRSANRVALTASARRGRWDCRRRDGHTGPLRGVRRRVRRRV